MKNRFRDQTAGGMLGREVPLVNRAAGTSASSRKTRLLFGSAVAPGGTALQAVSMLALGAVLALGGCNSAQQRSALTSSDVERPQDRVAARRSSLTRAQAASVRIYDEEPAGAFTKLGEVSVETVARYESSIESATERARRKLQRAAAALGAGAVIITKQRVVEYEHNPTEWCGPLVTFEGDHQDRLRPGDPDATTGRTVWRVKMVGVGVKMGA